MFPMDEMVYRLETLMRETVERLEETSLEDMEAFVQAREVIISEMKQFGADSFRDPSLKEAVGRVMELDVSILSRMEALKEEASTGLNKTRAARMQRNGYESKYAADSVFFDRKK